MFLQKEFFEQWVLSIVCVWTCSFCKGIHTSSTQARFREFRILLLLKFLQLCLLEETHNMRSIDLHKKNPSRYAFF